MEGTARPEGARDWGSIDSGSGPALMVSAAHSSYDMLFESAPCALVEEDFSGVRRYLQGLDIVSPRSAERYFAEHPGEIRVCARLIRITRANRAYFDVINHPYASRGEVIFSDVSSFFDEAGLQGLARQIQALLADELPYSGRFDNTAFSSRIRYVSAMMVRVTADATDWSRIVFSFTDDTEHQQREHELLLGLRHQQSLVRDFNRRMADHLSILAARVSQLDSAGSDARIREIFRDITFRLETLSSLYGKLFIGEEQGLDSIDLREYVPDLVGGILASLYRDGEVAVDYALDEAVVSYRTAVSVGTVLSEAVGNSIKHAFRESVSGRIRVGLRSFGEVLELSIEDSGKGFSESVEANVFSINGFSIMEASARQLGGHLRVLSGPGARVSMTFPVE